MQAHPGPLRLRHTIAFRLPLLVVGGLLATVLAALFVSFVIGRRQMIGLVAGNLRAMASVEAAHIAELLESQVAVVDGLAHHPATLAAIREANAAYEAGADPADVLAARGAAWAADPAGAMGEPVDDAALEIGGMSSYVLLDRLAKPVAFSHQPSYLGFENRSWWRELQAGASTVVAGPLVDLDSPATRVLACVVAIRDPSGRLEGAVYGAFDYGRITRSVVRGQFGGSGRTALVDGQGAVLYANATINEINQSIIPVAEAASGLVAAQGPGGTDFLMTAQSVQSSVAAINRLGWFMVAVQARVDAYEPLQRTLLPGAAAALLVAGLLVSILYRRYINPLTQDLNRLRVGAVALQQGARDPVVLRRPDELGLLAATFNAMASQLHQQLAQQESAITLATAELRRRAEQLHAAVQVGQAANATFDLERMMARTLELLREQFGYRYACIYLLDSRKEYAVAQASAGEGVVEGAGDDRGRRVAVGADSLVGWVTQHWSPRVAINDGPDAAFFRDAPLKGAGIQAALPLLSQGELLGALDVHGHLEQTLGEEDVATLQLLADQIASAIANARTFRQTELLTERQQRVLHLGQRMNRLHDEVTILATACRQIQEEFGYDAVHIAVGDEVSWTIRHAAGLLPALALPIGLTRPARSGLIGRAIRLGQPQLVTHRHEDDPTFFDREFPAMASEAAVPLQAGGQTFGALGVLMEQAGILSTQDLSLLALLAETVGSAVGNARLLRDLERNLSELDRLYRHSTHGAARPAAASEVTFAPTMIRQADLAPQLSLPLQSRGQQIGELTVESPAALSDDDQALVSAVANQLALAVENSRLFMQTRARLRETEALLSLAATLSTALEPTEIYERAGRTLAEQLIVSRLVIYSWDPAAGTLTSRCSLRRDQAGDGWIMDLTYHSLRLDDRAGTREALQAHAARWDEREDAPPGENHLLESPIVFAGDVLGLVEMARGSAFTGAEVRLLQAMGNQLAVALQNATLADETRGRVGQLTTLNRVGGRLAAAPDLEAVFEVVRDEILELTDATGLHVYLFDASSGAFHPAFRAFDPALDRLRLAQNDSRNDRLGLYVFRTRQVLVINASNDARRHPQLRDVLPEMVSFSWAGFPLVVSNETVGVLALEHSENVAAFLPDEIGLLSTIANAFAVAISSQLQLDRTRSALDAQRRQRLQLETAARVAAAASSILEVEVLLQEAVELIQEAFDLYYVGIYLADYNRNDAVLMGGTGSAGRAWRAEGHRLPIGGRSLVGTAMADGKARIAHDLREEPGWQPDPNLPHARSELALPLRVRDFISGALTVQSNRPDHFESETVQVLQTMADQLAIAISNAQLLQDTKAYSTQLQLAAEVGRAASTILDREQLGRTVVELIRERFGLYHVALFLAEGNVAVLYAGAGGAPPAEPEARPLRLLVMDHPTQEQPSTVGVAMSRGTAIYEPDLTQAPGWSRSALLPETRSVLTLPLMTRGHVVGAVSAQSDETDGFSPEEMAVLEVLADQLAVAFDNAELFSRTQQNLVASHRQYEAGQQLIRARDAGTVLETLVAFARDSEIVAAAGILLPEGQGESAALHHWWNAANDEPLPPPRFAVDDALKGDDGPAVIEPGTSELSRLTAFLAAQGLASTAILPIRADEEWRGSLLLARADGQRWDSAELQPYQTLVDQSATVLANQRLLAETNALYEISARLNQAITQEDLLELTLKAVGDHLGAAHGRFILFGPRRNQARLVARVGGAAQEATDDKPAPTRPLPANRERPATETATYALLAERRRPVYLPEATSTQATAAYAEQFGHYGATTTWLFPLRSQVQLLGYLALDNVGDRDQVRAAQRSFVEAVLRQLNTALENLRLLEDTLQRAQDLISLNQIGALISGALDLTTLADVVQTQVSRLLPTEGFVMSLYEEAGHWVEPVRSVYRGRSLPATGRPLAPDDALRDFLHAGMPLIGTPETPLVQTECRRQGLEPFASSLWIPLWREQTPIGYMAVTSDERGAYHDSHLHLFRSIGTQTSLAVTNAQLFQQTQDNIGELRRLLHVSQATASSVDATERLQATIEALDEALPGTDVAIYRSHEEDAVLSLMAASGRAQFVNVLPLDDGDAAADAGVIWLDGSPAAGQLAAVANGGPEPERREDYLLVPLQLGRRIVGAVAVRRDDRARPNENELRLLRTLSSSLASTLESDRLFTEIQAANQRLREIDRLKSQFLANMSHELRTPLNSIIGFSRLMLKGIDGPITEAQQEDLSSIHHSGQHLLRLINDILDMSKIEAGKMVLSFEPVALPEVAQQALAAVTPLLNERPVALRTRMAPDLPTIEADPIRLRQILLNLLSNAVKFTQEGWIELSIEAEGDGVHMAVADTGPGIAEDQFELLFREFEQLSTSATEETGGTGLGLPITRRLVEMHGGEIWVESELGQGATFHVRLPARRTAERGATAPSPQDAPAPA